MLPLLPLLIVLIIGFKRPGALVAGVIFSYTAAALSGLSGVSAGYTLVALAITSIYYFRGTPIFLVRLDLTVALFLLFVFLSTLWSSSFGHGFLAAINIGMAFASIYLLGKMAFGIGDGEDRSREFVYAICMLACIYAIIIPFFGDTSGARLTVDEEGSISVGVTQCYVAALVVAFSLLFQKSKWPLLRVAFCLIVLGSSVSVILITGTRGAGPAAIVGFIFYLAFTQRWRRLIQNIAIITTLATLVVFTLPSFVDVQTILDNRIFNVESYGNEYDPSSYERWLRFSAAADLFYHSPLGGEGAGGFSYLTNLGYPHNLILELAADFGAFGLAFFAIILRYSARTIRREQLLGPNQYSSIVIAMIVAALVQQQVSFSISMAKPLFLVGCLSGLRGTFSARMALAGR